MTSFCQTMEQVGILSLCCTFTIVTSALLHYKAPIPCNWIEINSTAIPDDTERLTISACKNLEPQPGALVHLYQLKRIFIVSSRITEFPNITEVGRTVVEIQFYHNNISYINPDFLVGFERLAYLNLGSNPYLAYIPDVPQLSTVISLFVKDTAFSRAPQLTHATNLQLLSIGELPNMKHMAKEDLILYPNLKTIKLVSNYLSEVPDFSLISDTLETVYLEESNIASAPPLHTLSMRNIKHLDVSLTPALSVLSTLCHEDLTSLSIDVSGSHVQLCDCRNVWLKQAAEAGAIITADTDTECDWHNATVMELLSTCTQYDANVAGGMRSMKWRSIQVDHPCPFPIHSIIPNMRRLICVYTCVTDIPGCNSVNYKPYGSGNTGDCMIIAPSDNPQTLPHDLTGWMYLGM